MDRGAPGLALLLAFAVTVLLVPLVARALVRWGALDRPSERSSHRVPTPRGGGLAVVAGIVVALVVASAARPVAAVLTAVLAFGLVGAVEDFRGIAPLPRFALQVVAAVATMVVWSPDPLVAGVAGGLLVVAFSNAFNFMDGINGISGVQAIAAATAYAAVAVHDGNRPLAAASLAVAGAALGFLPWNLPRAVVFLGDSGSYALGAALMLVALLLAGAGAPPEAVVAPLLVYVADTTTTLVRRVRRGERWYLPHRTHVYQRLTDLGWSHGVVSAFVLANVSACALLGLVSLTESRPMRVAADVAVVAVVLGYLAAPRVFRRTAAG